MNILSPLPKPIIYVCLLFAGALQTLTLAPYSFWILGPISIALILVSTQALVPSDHPPRGFFYGWLFGLGLFGTGASWVYVSINTYGNAPPILAGSLTIIFVAGLALFSALNFWLYFRLRSSNQVANGLLFTAIWVLGDAFRGVFLTGFPWLYLGYAHLESPVKGWIPIIGVHGLTFIAVLSGTALVLLYSSIRKRSLSLKELALPILTLTLWSLGPLLNTLNWSQAIASDNENEKKALSVALIQTNIPQELKWKRSQIPKTMRLLNDMSAEAWQSDLIVWPETAVPRLYDLARPFLKNMADQAKQHRSNIISGIPFRKIDEESGRYIFHNSIVSIGHGENIYHKQRLVPFGEYVPLEELLRGLIDFFNLPMSDFRTGSEDQSLLRSFDYEVAPFICYEVVYPDFVAKQSAKADFLITISNDSWFGSSIGPLQHLEMAQMRAAENARYMVRGTNNGISAVIDERGRIIDQTEQFVQTTLYSKIYLLEGRTPFSYTGSIPILLLCAVLILFQQSQRKQSSKEA